MTKAETDATRAARAALRAEEGALAAFFDAARAETPPLPEALVAAVLADAARAAAPAPPRPARARRGARPGLAALLGPLGGWPGATALAGCLAAGLVAGASQPVSDFVGTALWSDALAVEDVAAGVEGFFDLQETEG